MDFGNLFLRKHRRKQRREQRRQQAKLRKIERTNRQIQYDVENKLLLFDFVQKNKWEMMK